MFKVNLKTVFSWLQVCNHPFLKKVGWRLKFIFGYLIQKNSIKSVLLYEEKSPAQKKVFNIFQIRVDKFVFDTDGNPPFTDLFCQGFGFDSDIAASTCLGEFFERSSYLNFKVSDFIEASSEELTSRNQEHVSPYKLSVFSKRQQARLVDMVVPHGATFLWTKAQEVVIHNNEIITKPVLVPAQTIYWQFNRYHRKTPEPLLREIGTHGGAAYFTKEQAFLSGLYEWLSRETFFRHWLNGSLGKRLVLKSVGDARLQSLVVWLQSLSVKTHVFYLPCGSNIHSFFCILEEQVDGQIRYAFGNGVGQAIEAAIESSILEAMSVRTWMRNNRKTEQEISAIPYELWNDRERLSFFQTANGRDLLESITNKSNEISFVEIELLKPMSVQQETINCMSVLQEKYPSTQIIFHERQTELMKQIGFHSIKTLVTDCIPMYHNIRFAPEKYLAPVLPATAPFYAENIFPHPYP